ncbi:MAG TPA: nicotinate (nicotinamide) nucleotide adenylyltransferase [Candidatus Hydrogenedentes bacterium]|nr:nicotinate (nicotinamide) nucleotide adenylyltransferase [Candidatus Hydrogenedentota bacterium]
MSKPQRIGVFGGTFDPIHNAHVRIAKAAREQAQLDKVLFVVAAQPPHKSGRTLGASSEDRYAMVEAAVAEEPGLEASRVELDREGPSYTAETLDILQQQYPNAALFLIIGLDSLADLPHWRAPEKILTRAHLLVAPRPGAFEIPKPLEGGYTMLDIAPIAMSSTEVRDRAARHEPYEELLPPLVGRYVKQHGTYGA